MRYAIILLLFGCDNFFETEYKVHPKLKPYVDRFYEEALNRLILIDRENLIVRFEDMDCCSGKSIQRGNQRIVLIDYDSYTYGVDEGHDFIDPETGLSLGVQETVFHELGHAILFRDHENGYTIMTKDGKWNNDFNMHADKRKILIDELFKDCIKINIVRI